MPHGIYIHIYIYIYNTKRGLSRLFCHPTRLPKEFIASFFFFFLISKKAIFIDMKKGQQAPKKYTREVQGSTSPTLT